MSTCFIKTCENFMAAFMACEVRICVVRGFVSKVSFNFTLWVRNKLWWRFNSDLGCFIVGIGKARGVKFCNYYHRRFRLGHNKGGNGSEVACIVMGWPQG
mgnify:CR=1 FL=1